MKRCGNCGSTDVQMADAKGHSFPWKDYPMAYVSQSHSFLHCQNCGTFLFKAGETKILDRLLEESLAGQIQFFIQSILEREKCEQKELAQHVGVTPEYLSELKRGRIPKFQTFNFLKTLAMSGRKVFEVSSPDYDVTKQIAG